MGNRSKEKSSGRRGYLYDDLYRLLTVTAPKGEAFTYDPVGNRQLGPGAKDSGYQYNDGNQMTLGRKLQYSYDDRGNQTTKTDPAASDKYQLKGSALDIGHLSIALSVKLQKR